MFGRPSGPVPPASRAPTAKVSLPQANAVGGSGRLSSQAAAEAAALTLSALVPARWPTSRPWRRAASAQPARRSSPNPFPSGQPR